MVDINLSSISVAVLIPCHNEALTVSRVIQDFRKQLPDAEIYVCDNHSIDETSSIALDAGATVLQEPRLGKGNAVRRLFADIDADVFVLVDGDATYDPTAVNEMISRLVKDRLDMVVARRIAREDSAYRAGHVFGNRFLTAAVGQIFGRSMEDILSGYRVFSRRFVKSYPASSEGFEVETELTIHALELRLPLAEIEAPYFARPDGSESKLRTWTDGFHILSLIMRLFILEKPFRFFGWAAVLALLVSTSLFIPILMEFMQTGLVPRLPTLIISVIGYALALTGISVGLLLHVTTTGRLEVKRMAYLAIPALNVPVTDSSAGSTD